jgi:hypothetical protein
MGKPIGKFNKDSFGHLLKDFVFEIAGEQDCAFIAYRNSKNNLLRFQC